MNFSLIAEYADFLAALGVILSLVFVATQVRQNTAALKRGPRNELIDRLNAFHSCAFDKDLAATISKGQESYQSLNKEERLAFEGWMHQFVLCHANARSLQMQGILRLELREAIDSRVRWLFRHQGVMDWWHDEDRVPFAKSTIADIEEIVRTQ